MQAKEILENGADYFLPNLSIDLVIIGYQENALKCLLLKLGDKWILPGGYVKQDESVKDAVSRNLFDRTQLKNPYFKFLSVFGHQDRKFKDDIKGAFENKGIPWRKDYWINNRFVTLAYYSLVDIYNTHPKTGEFDDEVSWFGFDELPEMWLDHRTIVQSARNRLKSDVKHEQLSYNLLPDHFTMPALHRLHETILEEKIDRSRFQKKMLASGTFERLPKLETKSPGRNPYLYRFK